MIYIFNASSSPMFIAQTPHEGAGIAGSCPAPLSQATQFGSGILACQIPPKTNGAIPIDPKASYISILSLNSPIYFDYTFPISATQNQIGNGGCNFSSLKSRNDYLYFFYPELDSPPYC